MRQLIYRLALSKCVLEESNEVRSTKSKTKERKLEDRKHEAEAGTPGPG
jgi:hypothetical protein